MVSTAKATANTTIHGRHVRTGDNWDQSQPTIGNHTAAVHGGTVPDDKTGAILTPIYMSTAFVQPSVENYLSKGYSYTRQDNPTVKAYERRIASLEGGYDAICVSSGMAATTTVFAALLAAGDHCILTSSSYGGTNRCARVYFTKYNIEFTYVDMRDLNNVAKALKKNTKVVFSETPTNPVLHMVDIRKLTDMVKEYNPEIIHVCDSTFATPIICQPLDLGADIGCISLTKYYDGHNISVGGAIIVKDQEMLDRMSLQRNILGNIMTPQVAFLQLQTVKTLPIRVKQQSETALKIAKFLETHPAVASVVYPGLESFSQRAIAVKQHKNNVHGGMLCFEVKGGTAAGIQLMNNIKRPWTLCENLGSCESIITCPAVFTHANMLAEDRAAVGITDGLIRVSCGIEDAEDLINALKITLDNLGKF